VLAQSFTLSSPTIKPNAKLTDEQVFNGFGCAGKNVSPALAWKGAPAGTKSFAVTVYDPDAPTGSGWWHWVVVNLPASVTSLPAGAGDPSGGQLPAGAEQKMVGRVEGIINSMTPAERAKPELIKASRKRRIATGAGVQVQEVNRLLNQFEQTQKMMKQFSKGGIGKLMRGMKGMLPPGMGR
jgi:hypothetical protein